MGFISLAVSESSPEELPRKPVQGKGLSHPAGIHRVRGHRRDARVGQHCTQTITPLPEGNKAMAPFEQLQGSLCLCTTQGGGSSPDQPGPCKLLPGGMGSESVEWQFPLWGRGSPAALEVNANDDESAVRIWQHWEWDCTDSLKVSCLFTCPMIQPWISRLHTLLSRLPASFTVKHWWDVEGCVQTCLYHLLCRRKLLHDTRRWERPWTVFPFARWPPLSPSVTGLVLCWVSSLTAKCTEPQTPKCAQKLCASLV